MPVVLKSFGTAHGDMRYAGQYLQAFDFEAGNGRGLIDMTSDIQKAKVFADMTEAFEFYRHVPKCKPWREDGKPNRPLTASNWEFKAVAMENGKVKVPA